MHKLLPLKNIFRVHIIMITVLLSLVGWGLTPRVFLNIVTIHTFQTTFFRPFRALRVVVATFPGAYAPGYALFRPFGPNKPVNGY